MVRIVLTEKGKLQQIKQMKLLVQQNLRKNHAGGRSSQCKGPKEAGYLLECLRNSKEVGVKEGCEPGEEERKEIKSQGKRETDDEKSDRSL